MKKDLTIHYSSVTIAYWMGFAVVNAFASLYLLSIGFSNSAIGLLVAVASAAAAVLQPLLTSYADDPKSPALKVLMTILGGGIAFFGGLVLLFHRSSLASGLFYGLAITSILTLQPLVNALGMEALNQKKSLNFGLSRATGSIGYAVIASVLGVLAVSFGAKAVPVVYIQLFVLFGLFSITFPVGKGTERKKSIEENGNSKSFFSSYRRFLVVLVGCVCLYVSHIVTNNYTLQIVLSKGGTSAEMGIGTSIAAIVEIPTMVFFSFYLKRMKARTMLWVSGIFFTLKCFGTYLVTTMMGFYAVQFLQMFGWGLIAVALVYYVNEEMAPEDTIKGQGFASTAYTLGSIGGALAGGQLADRLGINAMLLFGSVISALGTLIIFFAVREKRINC